MTASTLPLPRSRSLATLGLLLILLPSAGHRYGDSLRPFTLDDAPRVRQPQHVALPANGIRLSYIVGDTLRVHDLEGVDRRRGVGALGGMSREVQYAIPFLAWSPDGSRLLVRSGSDGPGAGDTREGTPVLFDFERDGPPQPLLPDTLRGRISTFRSLLTPGPTWAPDNRRVAFVGWDLGRDAGRNEATLFVFDTRSGVLARFDANEDDKLGLAWSPDGRWLCYTTGAFSGQYGRVVLLDAAEPARRVAMFSGGIPLYRAPIWSPDSRALLVSDLQGRRTLLDVTSDGSLSARTSSLPRFGFSGWLEGGGAVLATVQDGMSTRLARLELSDGEVTFLTGTDSLFSGLGIVNRNGQDHVVFSVESGEIPLDVWEAPLRSGRALGPRTRLTRVNAWLDSVAVAAARVHRWTTPDGEELQAQLLLPRGHGPFPLVVMPYGSFRNEFPRSEHFLTHGLQALVSTGVAVARPNTRGLASQPQTDGRYGAVQLEDTERLVESLAALGVADSDRVALLGHSHGATMVYYYLTHSEAFRGGIAVNGAADWVFQAGLSSMAGLPAGLGGSPDELPDKYAAFSPLANAHRLNVPLLAVSGAQDTQIPERNAELMVREVNSHGGTARWLSFPDEGHLIDGPDNLRRFWLEILAFLEEVTAES